MRAGGTCIGAGLFALAGLMLGASASVAQQAAPVQGPALQTPAEAASLPVVLEMFTAQGCAACPPADGVFAEYADQPGVIALALHVDYWDYLGWEDSFADPAHTERQKAYARSAGAKMIYTPQVIIGGTERAQGNKSVEIAALVGAQRKRLTPVRLHIARQGLQLSIEAQSSEALPAGTMVQLVRYRPREDVLIEDGENAGRQISYRNIVTDWRQLGTWEGSAPLSLQATLQSEVTADQPVVVILQQAGPGAILAAARLD